ncbi:pancreatic lipase-related protein-like protein [Dinothrombium tinctorium]|uniref:Pancreatic lipase-related protein-like protein n=1 Tax=Dinothrombium tinctorium TaxID=1965070 RepID=A0A3S3NI48_9ACAR|nr:pancreatic lipase-related protein-like protein [Dinothrombium tinctorium]RWS03106.1 pancreatic lipase-related protein-like protein [Dinothrombium tinctorium]RWS08187.1 pancreatic lipase-related protein-like protein [Dinothrombium tinctorium]
MILTPQSPEAINVTYRLYTAKNKIKPVVLRYNMTKQDIVNTHFDPKKPSKFIIHGFLGSFDEMGWMGKIKDLFLTLAPEKFNIFGVDWSKGAFNLFYFQAAANTKAVAEANAHFINKLVKFTNANVEDIHLIGHSLGAQISGYTGKLFTYPKIGRVTALDPAGPGFKKKDPKFRLAPTDASYVEVIHTDAGNMVIEGFGLEDAVGHHDYYPNGGLQQPGCEMVSGIYELLRREYVSGIVYFIYHK